MPVSGSQQLCVAVLVYTVDVTVSHAHTAAVTCHVRLASREKPKASISHLTCLMPNEKTVLSQRAVLNMVIVRSSFALFMKAKFLELLPFGISWQHCMLVCRLFCLFIFRFVLPWQQPAVEMPCNSCAFNARRLWCARTVPVRLAALPLLWLVALPNTSMLKGLKVEAMYSP